MEMTYYLAVDIGASSGRHMLSHLEDGKLILEEIYRFPNGMTEKSGHKVWDVERLFAEILNGMKQCARLGKIPHSMGIDTWAVDYVLLDGQGRRIGDAAAYRDGRTQGMDKKVYAHITEEELYHRTGIQKQIFNTIYQLAAVREQHPKWLEQADCLLMMPDYFHFLLTGKKVQEYTNATTTQLVSPVTKDWDEQLIRQLGYPRRLFQEIRMPGYELGSLRGEIQKEVGFSCKVILPPTHDTASAVAAVPTQEEETLYISSGTWSLMGTERMTADCSSAARAHNMTNEGGYDCRFRYLKNIMGLWMIQSVRKESAPELGFGDLCARRKGDDRVAYRRQRCAISGTGEHDGGSKEGMSGSGGAGSADHRGTGGGHLPQSCAVLCRDGRGDRGVDGKTVPRDSHCGRRRECAVFKPAYRRIHRKDGRGGTDGGDGARQPCRADDCGGRI